jgi:hypothetical protein
MVSQADIEAAKHRIKILEEKITTSLSSGTDHGFSLEQLQYFLTDAKNSLTGLENLLKFQQSAPEGIEAIQIKNF